MKWDIEYIKEALRDLKRLDVYNRKLILKAIEKTAEFFKGLGLPSTLKKVGINAEKFEEMAEEAVRTSGISTRSYYHLNKEDIVKIYESCAE